MFALLKPKNPYEQSAELVYASCLQQTRQLVFYEDYGVPDSFDGRFDLLTLHLFLIVQRLAGVEPRFNQALFDVMFKDMDQTLREMGIGDVSVPKHMKRMMLAFNGRMHAYQRALEEDDLSEVLRRNVYGGAEVQDGCLELMESYVRDHHKLLQKTETDVILGGEVSFKDLN